MRYGSAPKGAPQTGRDARSVNNATAWPRPAVDCVEQLAEACRWLDASDLLLLDALGSGAYSLAEAVEHALALHGRIRRLLRAAVVEGVAA